MKYLQSYKIFESEVATDIIHDIKECFFGVSDMIEDSMNYGVRVNNFEKKRGKKMRQIGIKDVNYEVMIIPEIKPVVQGERYRPTNMDDEMIGEIENAISLTKGMTGLNFDVAAVEWINAYENGNGPGSDIKRFDTYGIIPVSDKLERGSYKLDYLFDYLILKGDKIRWVKLFFTK